MMPDKFDRELLSRYLNCETTPDEEREVIDWLARNPENQKEFDALDFAFQAAVMAAPEGEDAVVLERKKRRTARRILMWSLAAACIALVAFLGGQTAGKRQLDRLADETMSISVPMGQQIDLTLPDGTKVCLNAGARLQYPTLFSLSERNVRLEGEAMFDVAHDPAHPFTVETALCRVEALGTRFSVTTDESRNQFSSSLFNGRVRVTNKALGEQIILDPGRKVDLQDDHLAISTVQDMDDYLWTDGIISLNNITFEHLMERYERTYGFHVIYMGGTVPEISCRGKIRISDGIGHAMQVLQDGGTAFSYRIDYSLREIYIW